MEGYITLTEVAGNRWELTVRLPNKFLRQYDGTVSTKVYGHTLNTTWGREYTEESRVQPWRYMQQVYCSLEKAESAAAQVMMDLQAAKDALKPKGYVRFTLDLSPDAPLNAIREGNQAEDKQPF